MFEVANRKSSATTVAPAAKPSGLSFDDAPIHYKQDAPVQQKEGRGETTGQLWGEGKTTFQFKDNRGVARRQKRIVSSAWQMKGVPVQRRAIPVGVVAGVENIEGFKSKTYEKKNYNLAGCGNFDAKYQPGAKELNIKLPVYFKTIADGATVDFPNDKAQYFIDNVNKTWSNKYRIKTTATTTAPLFGVQIRQSRWQASLNPVKVNVEAEKKNVEADAYFKISSGATTSSVSNTGIVELRDGALGIGVAPDDFTRRNTVGHETGHMFGLDDEYQVENCFFETATGFRYLDNTNTIITKTSADGTFTIDTVNYKIVDGVGGISYLRDEHGNTIQAPKKTLTRHYDLTKKAFGQAYANTHATQQPSTNPDRVTNIMNSGTQVKKHHYVTFWDAMVQAIQEPTPAGYGAAKSNIAPNQHEDWKIV